MTISIAVKNGAYTEPPEYNGLSHLYEHMFFKGNRAIPNQEPRVTLLLDPLSYSEGSTEGARARHVRVTVEETDDLQAWRPATGLTVQADGSLAVAAPAGVERRYYRAVIEKLAP